MTSLSYAQWHGTQHARPTTKCYLALPLIGLMAVAVMLIVG